MVEILEIFDFCNNMSFDILNKNYYKIKIIRYQDKSLAKVELSAMLKN